MRGATSNMPDAHGAESNDTVDFVVTDVPDSAGSRYGKVSHVDMIIAMIPGDADTEKTMRVSLMFRNLIDLSNLFIELSANSKCNRNCASSTVRKQWSPGKDAKRKLP